MMIQNYSDFCTDLLRAGFSMSGGSNEGIYCVVPFNWNEPAPYETPVHWHTGDIDTDPWEWRMRVLEERDDVAYAKLFFKKGGYITKEWYPYFLSARRKNRLFEEEYELGTISQAAKQIYTVLTGYDCLSLHELKAQAGFNRENKAIFERALVELQMKLYITICGRQQKLSPQGEPYGWNSTVLCTTEQFWGHDVFDEAEHISFEEATEAITKQVLLLNPDALPRKINRFIHG